MRGESERRIYRKSGRGKHESEKLVTNFVKNRVQEGQFVSIPENSKVSSCVTYAETMASFWRKKREGPTSDELIQKVVELFKRDWESFVRVEVNEDLNQYVDLLVERHPLRGFDAIHLASVKVIHDSLPGNLIFLCFDRRLASAAHEEGLKIFGEGCEE